MQKQTPKEINKRRPWRAWVSAAAAVVILTAGSLAARDWVPQSGSRQEAESGQAMMKAAGYGADTGWAYDAARQFGLRVTDTRPALVPLTFEAGLLETLTPLAGVAVDAVVKGGGTSFAEAMLFTHRGLSGPAILQISSYWREG